MKCNKEKVKEILIHLTCFLFIVALFIFLLLLFSFCANAKSTYSEAYYQKKYCEGVGGVMEYRLKDNTRVDCLTDEYAIEVDFAKKWAESLAQSLHYAIMTGKKPAILLIMEKEGDNKYYSRLYNIIDTHDLNVEIFLINEYTEIKYKRFNSSGI